MHSANRRLADCSWGVRLALSAPGGCRRLHAFTAFLHTAGVTLTPYSKSFFALGSGKSLTPWARMHSANRTALSRALSFVPAVAVAVAPASLSDAASEPQPAPITAISARANNGRSALFISAPVRRRSGPQSRRRGVAAAYAFFNTRAICALGGGEVVDREAAGLALRERPQSCPPRGLAEDVWLDGVLVRVAVGRVERGRDAAAQ